jgi:hypothetical protein
MCRTRKPRFFIFVFIPNQNLKFKFTPISAREKARKYNGNNDIDGSVGRNEYTLQEQTMVPESSAIYLTADIKTILGPVTNLQQLVICRAIQSPTS